MIEKSQIEDLLKLDTVLVIANFLMIIIFS